MLPADGTGRTAAQQYGRRRHDEEGETSHMTHGSRISLPVSAGAIAEGRSDRVTDVVEVSRRL